ncbi:MAG: nucleoside triphosphate pyrophosphatase [Candidatus Margulisiibacteriota bacterium]
MTVTDARPVLALASASPRRSELLSILGLPFIIVPSRYTEPPLDPTRSPAEQVETHAIEKAKQAILPFPLPVLGADTVVSCDGQVLGKPTSVLDADRMLTFISGKAVSVISGMALLSPSGRLDHTIVRTTVHFRAISLTERIWYIASGEPLDKAGAFGIQGKAAIFIKKIDGDYFNIVGLSLFATAALLAKHGLEVAKSLRSAE